MSRVLLRSLLPVLVLSGAAISHAAEGAPPPAAAHWNLEELEVRVDTVVREAMESEHLPGVALVLVQGGKVQMARGWGWANLERKQPVDPDRTLFRIGSITKAFTAMAVLQLHDNGRVDLEADANRYFDPPVVPDRFGEPIRVWHLLTHTAGFDQTGLGRHAKTVAERASLDGFVRNELVRVRPPGILATYDTYGIALAGHLVETVGGMSYADYMRQRIFQPLGMDRTYVEAPEKLRSDLATGYGFDDGVYVPQRYEIYVTTPASSIDATARDMGRFLVAALGDGSNQAGRFVSEAAVARLKEPQFREHPEFPGYVWGFWERLGGPARVIHHGGTMLGFTSDLWLLPEQGVGFFVATNRDGEAGGGPVFLRRKLGKALMGSWFPDAEPVRDLPAKPIPVDTAHLAGNWATTIYCHTCAAGEGWTMYYAPLESVGPGVIQYEGEDWFAEGPGVFISESGNDRLAFLEDAKNRTRYLVHQRYRMPREKLDDTLLDDVYGSDWPENKPRALAAQTWRANGEWEKAAREFERIARGQASPSRSWFRTGSAWLRAEKPGRALPVLKRAWKSGKLQAETAYAIALAYTMQENADKAFQWLRQALDAGLEEPAQLRDDPRQSLRDDPRFAKLLANG